jgi:hypothetical protein
MVAPDHATLAAGKTAPFSASVSGTADTSVSWDVLEPDGGSVSTAGLYTAPGTAGVFHVRARSNADPSAAGESTVTVMAPVSVAVLPEHATLAPSAVLTFAATVSNTANTTVVWSVLEAGCGSITSTGSYTAPPTAAACTVIATSVADPTKSGSSAVRVVVPPPPVAVAIAPSPASADACTAIAFTATVAGTPNQAVTWSVQEPEGGAIAPNGVYTAPPDAGTYHVVATSDATPANAAVVAITVSDRIVAVTVSPETVAVPPNGTAQLTATVTTTCGDYTEIRTLTAAGTVVTE